MDNARQSPVFATGEDPAGEGGPGWLLRQDVLAPDALTGDVERAHPDATFEPAQAFQGYERQSEDEWFEDSASTSYEPAEDREIIGPDERRLVSDTLAVPYRWICSLDVTYATGDTFRRGTGLLIGPRHVLTAAHNIYRPDGSRPSSVYAAPARDGRSDPLGRVKAVAYTVTSAFLETHRVGSRFDFALITLEKDISAQTHRAFGGRPLGYWGHPQLGHGTVLRALRPDFLAGKPVMVSGYPGDWCGRTRLDPRLGCPKEDQATAQVWDHGLARFDPHIDGILLHTADTYGGHSGAPVWMKFSNGNRYLVGVHVDSHRVRDAVTGRDQPIAANRAVHLSDDVLRVVRSWMPPADPATGRSQPPLNPPMSEMNPSNPSFTGRELDEADPSSRFEYDVADEPEEPESQEPESEEPESEAGEVETEAFEDQFAGETDEEDADRDEDLYAEDIEPIEALDADPSETLTFDEALSLQRAAGQPLRLPAECVQRLKVNKTWPLSVAVVGGGLAGLMAARTLCRQGVKVTVFEARKEVGGRVLSDYGNFCPGRITEYGAELVGSIHTRWCALAIEYGLALISRMDTNLYRGQQLNLKLTLDKPLSMDEIRLLDEAVDEVLFKIAKLASDINDPSQPWLPDNMPDARKKEYDNMSVAEALVKKFGVIRDSRVWKALKLLLEHNNVKPLDQLNFLGLLCLVKGGQSGTIAGEPKAGERDERLMGYWSELEIYRCADGCQQLAFELAKDVRMLGGDVRPSRAVTHIHLAEGGRKVWVTSKVVHDFRLAGQPRAERDYDYVILAIPPTVWSGVTITPVHPKEPGQVGVMDSGNAVKFFRRLKNRFWIRDAEAPYGGSQDLGHVWEGTDNQTRFGDQGIVLGVFAGGPKAFTTTEKFEEGLTKLYKNYPRLPRGVKYPINPPIRVANWLAEPFIKTGYASPGPGQILTVGRLLHEPFTPFKGRLLFAGEHTQMDHFGYMEGALRSGERAAESLIRHACDLPRNKPPAPAPRATPQVRVASAGPKREAEAVLPGEEIDYGWSEDLDRGHTLQDDQPEIVEPGLEERGHLPRSSKEPEYGSETFDELHPGEARSFAAPEFGLDVEGRATPDEPYEAEELFEAEELARHAVYETVSGEGADVGTGRGGQALQEVATVARPAILPTAQLRSAWRAYECAEQRMVPLRLFGRWNTPVNPATVDAWRAFERTLVRAGYQAHRAWVYICKDIGGQKTRSLHAYGLAIDIDHKQPECNVNRATPDNRLVRFSPAATKEERCRDVGLGTADTSFTPDQVAAVEAIRTVDGHQVFAWGGRWRTTKDTMHFQINVTPDELARGIRPDAGAATTPGASAAGPLTAVALARRAARRQVTDVSGATRYIAVACPSQLTNKEWRKVRPWYGPPGTSYIAPPPVYNDYALMKVLYTLRLRNKDTRFHVNAFQYEEPLTPLDFSGLQDSDVIFIAGHGNDKGLYVMGPKSSTGLDRLVDILTADGNLKKHRKGKKITILLLSCRAGLGFHKGLARRLSKRLSIDTTVGGAQGYTFGSTRTTPTACNEVLIRGIPWVMEYPTSLKLKEAENATSAREGKTITVYGKRREISRFLDDKKGLEKQMKEVVQQLRSTEVNNALDEIDTRFRSRWLGLLRAQFELYALAKKRSNLEFDMWFDHIADGYLWTDRTKTTDQEVNALLTGTLVPVDGGLTSTR